MKSLIIIVILTLSVKNYAFAGSYKPCHGSDKADCLHAQGIYTEEEFDAMDINKIEVTILKDKNSELNKYVHGKVKSNTELAINLDN